MRSGKDQSDELRRRVYRILTSVSGISARNIATFNSATISNVTNTSSFATRFARGNPGKKLVDDGDDPDMHDSPEDCLKYPPDFCSNTVRP